MMGTQLETKLLFERVDLLVFNSIEGLVGVLINIGIEGRWGKVVWASNFVYESMKIPCKCCWVHVQQMFNNYDSNADPYASSWARYSR